MMLKFTRAGFPRKVSSWQVRTVTILSLSLSKGVQNTSHVTTAGNIPLRMKVMTLVCSFLTVFRDV